MFNIFVTTKDSSSNNNNNSNRTKSTNKETDGAFWVCACADLVTEVSNLGRSLYPRSWIWLVDASSRFGRFDSAGSGFLGQNVTDRICDKTEK